jgi:hypothetical protein
MLRLRVAPQERKRPASGAIVIRVLALGTEGCKAFQGRGALDPKRTQAGKRSENVRANLLHGIAGYQGPPLRASRERMPQPPGDPRTACLCQAREWHLGLKQPEERHMGGTKLKRERDVLVRVPARRKTSDCLVQLSDGPLRPLPLLLEAQRLEDIGVYAGIDMAWANRLRKAALSGERALPRPARHWDRSPTTRLTPADTPPPPAPPQWPPGSWPCPPARGGPAGPP